MFSVLVPEPALSLLPRQNRGGVNLARADLLLQAWHLRGSAPPHRLTLLWPRVTTPSPWQRGSNENTNGLLRQYYPKGMDISGYSQSYLNKIALRLNQRPRKTLGFE